MIERTADANWKGRFADGHGLTSTESRVLIERRFDAGTRFNEDSVREGITNPEELLAAAAASCFCMAFAKKLSDEGYEPVEIRARAHIGMDKDDEGPFISSLRLKVEGLVPGISKEDFIDFAEETEEDCPVFQLLGPGLDDVELEAELQS